MTVLKSWPLLAICLIWAVQEESVCVHTSRGDSHATSLEAVGRAQEDIKRRLALSWESSLKVGANQSFESGLPACGPRKTRRFRTQLPPDMVGKTIAFAPSDRMPDADVRVATSVRKLIDVQADALADRALVERLDVRCTPTIVRGLSEVELELVESP